MCRVTLTHGACPHQTEVYHDEWRDKWGNAHEINVVQCIDGCHPGLRFNPNDKAYRECQDKANGESWEKIVAEQAACAQ